MRRLVLGMLLLVACTVDGTLGKDGQGGGTGGISSSTGTDATSVGSSSTDATSAGTAGMTSSASGSGDSSGSATTTGGTVCEPTGSDHACSTCMKGHCCEHLEACVQAGNCDCILDCMAEGGTATACINHCADASPEAMDLHTCEQNQCAAACPA